MNRAVWLWGYGLFAVAVGFALPFQFGVNAQLARWLESPVRAALLSFVVSTSSRSRRGV